MTLSTLIINIGIAAIVFSLLVAFVFKEKREWLMTYLQSFCGVLFLFSGWVKAVDPLGTAYKMEQYFSEFESVFEGTWFSFLSPVFPIMAEYGIWFSVFMIVFEIVLGIMLLIGAKPKFLSWAFFLLLVLFTILTGFTFLTGYVPQDVNFFNFSSWGPYVKSNMKVTDCGCFGDFIKLEPKTSFFKDIVLMVPAFYFLFRRKDMHQFFTEKVRSIITWLSLILVTIYCMNNYSWSLPHHDFRPFYKGADIKTQRQLEFDAMANVQIKAWKLKNRANNEIVEIPNDIFMKQISKYPKAEWEYLDQIKTKPEVAATKVSEFEISDLEGNDLTENFLNSKEAALLIVSHKVPVKTSFVKELRIDSIFSIDTVRIEQDGLVDTMIVRQFDRTEEKEYSKAVYTWNQSFVADYKNKIANLVKSAKTKGVASIIVTGGADPDILADLEGQIESGAQYATADDILLKTLIRSNPGVMLWKDGKVIDKWHIKKLPSFDEIDRKYLNN